VLFSSNPRGNDEEGWSGGRFGVYYRLETWRRHVTAAGFAELAHYYRPAGLPRAQQPWLATVWRKVGDARDANNVPDRDPRQAVADPLPPLSVAPPTTASPREPTSSRRASIGALGDERS
jgi:hypothetical protein